MGERQTSFLKMGDMDRATSHMVTEHVGGKDQGTCQWNI